MAYIKTEWENLPSTKTPINASNLNKIENGIYTNSVNIGELTDLTTTNKNSVVGAINQVNTNLNKIKIVMLNDTDITTKAVHTLKDNVNNYDFILVFATENQWGHYQMCTILKHSLYNTYSQYVQYSATGYFNTVKLYDTTLDTSEVPGFGDNYKRITRLYGVKL